MATTSLYEGLYLVPVSGQNLCHGAENVHCSGGIAVHAYRFDSRLRQRERLPAGRATLALRVTVDFPSDGPNVLSETAGLDVPVTETTWLTPSLTLEEARRNSAILALGLYHRFD